MDALDVPATLESLQVIRDFVFASAEGAGIDKKRAHRLALAVDEIATNIIVHGYQEAEASGGIRVFADTADESLTITLEDTAVPYNPLDKSDPTDLGAPLEDRQIGGLGVYLAVRNVDKFDYEYSDGRNRNIFVINRVATVASDGLTNLV
jgi:serine/threonine-protein kinase RsbW